MPPENLNKIQTDDLMNPAPPSVSPTEEAVTGGGFDDAVSSDQPPDEAARKSGDASGFAASTTASDEPPTTPTESEPSSSSSGSVATGDRTTYNRAVLNANVGDQPTEVDTIGFEPYVEAIASFLTNKTTKPPLTLSIEGEWGSGKSSFMLQLEKKLRERGEKSVRFNAWRHDKDDAMWAAFALEFIRRLSKELSFRERWWAHVKLLFRRFSWERGWLDVARLAALVAVLLTVLLLPLISYEKIKSFVAPPQPEASASTVPDKPAKGLDGALRTTIGLGGVLGYLALVSLLLLKVKDFVGNPLNINLKKNLDSPDYKSRIAFIEQFHDDFGKIVETYVGTRKVYVFIDDLDRCEVPKAADLMQALNLMVSDVKQLIFIMGMDREKVAAGLAVKYEKLLPYLAPAPSTDGARSTGAAFDPVLGLEYGYSFIEKFVQLPFLVPQASQEQVEYFLGNIFNSTEITPPVKSKKSSRPAPAGKMAEEQVSENSQMVEDIIKMVAPTFEYNPRRLKQFINLFRLKTFIASRTGLFDSPEGEQEHSPLTPEQLGKFVAISLRWPLLLADLDADRNLLSTLQRLVLRGKSLLYYESSYADRIEVWDGKLLSEVEMRWLRRANLWQLLRAECDTPDHRRNQIYSLGKLNVNKLMQVSPLTRKSPAPAETNEPTEAPPPSPPSNSDSDSEDRDEWLDSIYAQMGGFGGY